MCAQATATDRYHVSVRRAQESVAAPVVEFKATYTMSLGSFWGTANVIFAMTVIVVMALWCVLAVAAVAPSP